MARRRSKWNPFLESKWGFVFRKFIDSRKVRGVFTPGDANKVEADLAIDRLEVAG